MLLRDALSSSGIDTLDAELLLCTILQKPRTWLIAHAGQEVGAIHMRQFQNLVARRKTGEPIAYILNRQDFFGKFFHVNPSVMIPRPATERLVEIALQALNGEKVQEITRIDTEIVAWHIAMRPWKDIRTVIDIGTGSGCIAVTLAWKRPDLRIVATDISSEALDIARQNAVRNGVYEHIDFRIGSGFAPIADMCDPYVIISNPPYIPDSATIDPEVYDFEPHNALFAGPKGTNILESIVAEAHIDPNCCGWIMECRNEQCHDGSP